MGLRAQPVEHRDHSASGRSVSASSRAAVARPSPAMQMVRSIKASRPGQGKHGVATSSAATPWAGLQDHGAPAGALLLQPAARCPPAGHVVLGVAPCPAPTVAVVLVLAHRGLPGADRPENTVAAVAAALDAGADGVEVDLRLTADGVLAVSHDPDLARVTGLPAAVATSPWATLAGTAGAAGVRLARVEQVLAVAAGRRVVLEVKKPPPGPGAEARTALAVAGQLRCLQRAGLPLDVTVSSFSATLVGTVRELLPAGTGVRTALLGRPLDRATSVLRQALDGGHDEVHPHVLALLAEPRVVAAAHGTGTAVVPWTVNRRRDVRRLGRLGVDAVITDVPASARAALAAPVVRRTA